MAKMYVVEYHYELFGERHEEETHLVGLFDTFENGLAYLRKFYEGDERDKREFVRERITQTEWKGGERTAEAARTYNEGNMSQVEHLKLYALSINQPTDPYTDIMELWQN